MVRERGSDNESQLRYGSEMFANPQNRKDYPAFVLFPQCPLSNFWPFESQPASYDATTFPIDYPTSTPIKLVKELIDSYLQMEEIDKEKGAFHMDNIHPNSNGYKYYAKRLFGYEN